MANILDLPFEVLDIIFGYLNYIEDEFIGYAELTRIITAKLRLVCRNWADWFFENYLYNRIDISGLPRGSNAYRKIELINLLTNCSTSLARTKCYSLKTTNLRPFPGPIEAEENTACRNVIDLNWRPFIPDYNPWPGPDELWKRTHDEDGQPVKTAFEVFGSLVELFSHSIVKLTIDFSDFVLLPIGTIEAIGRIQNLRVLRICHLCTDGGRLTVGTYETPDLKSLLSLISGVHEIKRLDLMELHENGIFLSKVTGSTSPLYHHQPVGITQLVIHFSSNGSLDYMAKIVGGFKRTIKILTIPMNDKGDGQRMMPIFENLRENLEGLFVFDGYVLSHILDFKFPKLRVFSIHVHFAETCISDLFNQNLFSYAPIEIISIGNSIHHRPGGSFKVDPFANMPRLRRLVLPWSWTGYDPSEHFQLACKKHGVEWVPLDARDGDLKAMIMKL
ncbi:hypothetical protein MJO28_015116 [Puccinia striiformis f. sp. tritici]|uniref:F-box domain-containing protein n=3 Tax=Puccinia striiformis TaxID=27350 RepID=A0A0L0UW96_9BASI|nr:hypothetical protein Pst134EB_028494 [Puccinia striiformis f. sp. tritici]KNE91295.1 hypothetical protein, variant 1 [Puccinia striiformis f. sp. tritici PST-78]POW08884.1 hypothetical protein PSTT_07170 [Puccinia striiformis]KAI7937569.1 hypothetical protein MJO29_014884 [Puccinia striiformis f. sp. tritici]KAI7938196.1 hypothetical protein MJO28_015116 [Puccinia striiformis f. sp. tritici]